MKKSRDDKSDTIWNMILIKHVFLSSEKMIRWCYQKSFIHTTIFGQEVELMCDIKNHITLEGFYI